MRKLVLFSFALLSSPLLAQSQSGNALINGIETTYTNVMTIVVSVIYPEFRYLFWGLTSLSFVYMVIQWALTESDTRSLLSKFSLKVLFIGIALACFNHVETWGSAVVNSFKLLGEKTIVAAGGVSEFHAIDLITSSIEIVKAPFKNFNVLETGPFIISCLMAMAIVYCYVKISVAYILTVIESKFVILIQLILFSFSGASWFSSYFKTAWVYSIAVGIKLFFIYVLIGLGHLSMTVSLDYAKSGNISDMFYCLVSVGFLMMIVEKMPNKVESLVSGITLTGSSNGVQALQQMAQTSAAAVGGALGGAAVLKAANEFGKAQSQGKTGAGRALSFAGHALGGLAKGMGEELAAKMKGSPESKRGNMGFRMADSLNNRLDGLKGDRLVDEGSSKPDSSKESNSSNEKMPDAPNKDTANEKSQKSVEDKMNGSDTKGSESQGDEGKNQNDLNERLSQPVSDFSMKEAEDLGAFDDMAMDNSDLSKQSNDYRSSVKNLNNNSGGEKDGK